MKIDKRAAIVFGIPFAFAFCVFLAWLITFIFQTRFPNVLLFLTPVIATAMIAVLDEIVKDDEE